MLPEEACRILTKVVGYTVYYDCVKDEYFYRKSNEVVSIGKHEDDIEKLAARAMKTNY